MGCGYAAPAAWLLEIYPDLRFLACDPDERRARIAARILDKNGEVRPCRAQDLSLKNERADAVLLLDVIHYFSDLELREFLGRIRPVLPRSGKLIIRVTIPGLGFALFRWVEGMRLRVKGRTPNFRTREQIIRILEEADFKPELLESTAPGREETWVIAVAGAKEVLLN